ncbi:hypothetical protein [Mycobacterium sp. 852002-40037_SCH5390672]|uniref:hypothetical protein n=1 Tax=Mycobacterium sp. 852002-40037_SCH5390672 TaxID=1834089 RepID=UPI000804CE61|nr:hypothetical protein [Mycobacterium sp. 852002-40037_SCH5390672]OBB97443.1 hypothetical protein A5782_02725 [Mycobacterium sp. 852002-40037_SCH5390672]
MIAVGIVTAVVLVGILVVVGVQLSRGHQSATAPSAQPSPSAPESFAIPGCYNPSVPPVPRPKKLNVLGCASVAVALQDMSWTSWGPQGADGTGTALFKLCDPNCAAGSQLTEPVEVHAWNPQPPRREAICQVGLEIFADMILAFPKGAPPPNVQKMNTQYHGEPAVHFANYSSGDTRGTQFIGYTFCN